MYEIMLNRGAGWWAVEYDHYPDAMPLITLRDSTDWPVRICLRTQTLDAFKTGRFYVYAKQER